MLKKNVPLDAEIMESSLILNHTKNCANGKIANAQTVF